MPTVQQITCGNMPREDIFDETGFYLVIHGGMTVMKSLM